MVGIRGLIAYTVKRLKEHKMYRRTFVQKILYFSLPAEVRDELFIPYLYGPYSAGIQRIIQYLEANPEYIEQWENEINDHQVTEKIDKLILFINENRIQTKHLSQLAKLHYILNIVGVQDIDGTENIPVLKIKEKSATLGWLEFSKISEKELAKLMGELKVLSKN